MASKDRTFAIIGLGSFGSTVAAELAQFGNYVLGIDIDERKVNALASTLAATAILDASDETALREVGVDQYDVALCAIGDSLEASILTTMNLRLLGVETIWVKATTKPHHRILSKLGADRVILPEQEMGRHISQMLNNPTVQDYVNLGNGFSVVSMVVPKAKEGTLLDSLKLEQQFDLRALGLMRKSEFVSCARPDVTLCKGDKLLVLGKRIDLVRFGDTL